MKNIAGFPLMFIMFLLIMVSCREQKKVEDNEEITAVAAEKDYISLIISLDTLPTHVYRQFLKQEDSLLNLQPNKDSNPFFHYFRARKYIFDNKKDSAVVEYGLMTGKQPNDEIDLLKKCSILTLSLGNGVMVEAGIMKQIFAGLETTEHLKSKLSYRYYDLLAMAYFQNDNYQKSLKYAELYYKNHPYNTHAVVEQRYYDISFLLASELGNYKKMTLYNNKARNLAEKIGDELAIARTYDNEAHIYSKQLQFDKSLAYSRRYYSYLKKTNNLNAIAFNNLATSFNLTNQPDSAIYYYKTGIAFYRKNLPAKQKAEYYNGLVESYKMKGDYYSALSAADSAYTIELKNLQAIEAVKVAEMHEKYETEKKDRSITELNSRNELNETIIKQQKWSLFLVLLIFLGLLSFFYIVYHQQRLKEKNTLLKSDNQRLIMEQRMLQAQLNPHFIFNAIANLQGLVASGQIQESVQYLTSFSSLLRGILEQNRKDFIAVEDEIASLTNYIELQKMRYADVFDYKISVDEHLDLEEILIPPMLIQPFVENAIEHGFRQIDYQGHLLISFKEKNNQLIIEVDDNGGGLKKHATEKRTKKSLAQIILKERFELLFTSQGNNADFKVIDKVIRNSNGVLVEITIPIIKD